MTIQPDGNGTFVDNNPLANSGFYRTLLHAPAMNTCPRCRKLTNPLRLFWQSPYVCPKCGTRSVHSGRWMGLRYLLAPAASGLSAGLLRDWLGWNREFFLDHPAASIWVFAIAVVQIVFWLVIIRWLSGRLVTIPEQDQGTLG